MPATVPFCLHRTHHRKIIVAPGTAKTRSVTPGEHDTVKRDFLCASLLSLSLLREVITASAKRHDSEPHISHLLACDHTQTYSAR